MDLLMTDRPLGEVFAETEARRCVDLTQLKIANCTGCFGCWTKTPGRCVLRDDAVKVYPLIARARRVLYVTRVRYGSYDIPMKTMLERAIPVQKAFIRLHHGETHHEQRAVEEKDAVIIAYGARSAEARTVFEHLIGRNANNMLFNTWKVRFVDEAEVEAAVQEEVRAWQN